MTKILVTAKVNPDLDGVACTLAYANLLQQLGENAEGVVFGNPQSEVQYFIKKQAIEIPTQSDQTGKGWDKYIFVDASSTRGMPQAVRPKDVIEIIDHRKGEPENEFPNAKIQNELIGAAATLIVERFIEANKKPLLEHAKLLYGAIYHNTLNFIASNTSDRDRKATSYLEKEFELTPTMTREMFEFATNIIVNDIKQAIADDAKEFGSGFDIAAFQLVVWGSEILNQKSIIENSVDSLTTDSGANWGFLNLIDLESKKSIIFCNSNTGQKIIEKALDCKFTNNWTELDKAWLRKQIMPNINEVIHV